MADDDFMNQVIQEEIKEDKIIDEFREQIVRWNVTEQEKLNLAIVSRNMELQLYRWNWGWAVKEGKPRGISATMAHDCAKRAQCWDIIIDELSAKITANTKN